MPKEHRYQCTIQWTGNKGAGTSSYAAYSRDHSILIAGKPVIPASSDPAFRGDPSRYNPEELLLASLSSCHMLWFLHLCAESGVVVLAYTDEPVGILTENPDGSGQFTEVIIRPEVIVSDSSMIPKTHALHTRANSMCFIANSCKFPVRHQPACRTAT